MQDYLSRAMTQIPDDVARLAHEQQLGTPQAGLLVTKLSKGWRWVSFLRLVLVALVLIFMIVLFVELNSPPDYMPFPAILFFIIPIYGFCIALVILSRTTSKMCSLYPCDQGFILRFSSSRFRVIRWDEVATVWQTVLRTPATFYMRNRLFVLRCQDGNVLTFRTFIRSKASRALPIKSIEDVIEEYFTRRRLPLQLADYQDGQTLSFGLLSVNRDGIRLQDRQILWEQVADLSLVGKRLLISQTGESPSVWASLPALSILDTKSYYFSINTSGNYTFIYYPDVMNGNTSQTLQSGTTKLMHKGYGAQNQLTLIAIGSLFYIYLNQQFVVKVTDPTLSIGELSLLVDSETAPTEAVFSQAVAWNIAGMAP